MFFAGVLEMKGYLVTAAVVLVVLAVVYRVPAVKSAVIGA